MVFWLNVVLWLTQRLSIQLQDDVIHIARRLDNNAILSITATIVSICALFVAAYQTMLMRQQQDAAVWPKLVISHAYVSGAGSDSFYRLQVRNVGIGPAIIDQVRIQANGHQFTTMYDYAKAVLTSHNALDSLSFDATDLSADDVIPQGERRELFNTYKNHFANYFVPGQIKFKIVVDYKSIYGQKWQVTLPR